MHFVLKVILCDSGEIQMLLCLRTNLHTGIMCPASIWSKGTPSCSSTALGLPKMISTLYFWLKAFRLLKFGMNLQPLFLFFTREELVWSTSFFALKQTGLIALSPLNICFLPKQERSPKRMGVGREWWGGK